MSRSRQYHKRQAKAIQRRRHTAAERLQHDRRQAQHAAKALQQALDDLGRPEDLVNEIEGRLRSQHKLRGKIVGPTRGAAQTVLDQAPQTLGSRGIDPAVALCCQCECGYAQPLAMDLGCR